jgi:hypothetical protein
MISDEEREIVFRNFSYQAASGLRLDTQLPDDPFICPAWQEPSAIGR